jgi:Holliday junction resolvasome RuvABC endonuclease subunit
MQFSENLPRIFPDSLSLPVSELNPQEYVNQDVKTNVLGKGRPINKVQMRTNVEEFMNGRKKDKMQVQKHFHVKQVRYAA